MFYKRFFKFFVIFIILVLLVSLGIIVVFRNIVSTAVATRNIKDYKNIIVLGSSVYQNEPRAVLRKRLEKTVEIFQKESINKILVSGGNTVEYNNEPKVMKDYLIENGVPEAQIVEDFGGRRTADTCYRAKNYFKVKTAIIITQSDHLARTQFLCDDNQLKTYPIIADYPSDQSQLFNIQREFLAIWPSILDKIYYQPTIKSDGKETQIGN